MINVLIIGDDVHTIRYLTSLLFNNRILIDLLDYGKESRDIAKKYRVKLSDGKEINKYDIILYSKPNFNDKNLINILKDYNNILLLEKPVINLNIINNLSCKSYVIHLRDYDFDAKNVEFNNNSIIIWPNLKNDGMSRIVNTFPNIFDYLCNITNNSFDFKIVSVSHDELETNITLNCHDINFNIKIFDTTDKEILPTLNGESINWPNYFKCINSFFEEVLKENLNFKFSVQREKIINLLIRELEEKNGDIKYKI